MHRRSYQTLYLFRRDQYQFSSCDSGVSSSGISLTKESVFLLTEKKMAKIGDLCEIGGEVIFEWKIKDFLSLPEEKNVFYYSSTFYFADASWNLKIYPFGVAEDQSEGCIGLYLLKRSYSRPISVNYAMGLKTLNGNKDPNHNFTYVFDQKDSGFGTPKLISRSSLSEKKSELTPSDILTVICTLKHSESKDMKGSFFNRLQGVSDNLKEIYVKAKRTDILLKLDGGNIRAHRLILETRSPVFAAMFSHDTKENQTGEICIDDMNKKVMESILIYMYSGQSAFFENLTTENAISVYDAAEKYDIKDVKETCLMFIAQNLTVECVLDVIQFTELYQIEELGNCARKFFKENASQILETEKWKIFAKENHDTGMELLGSLVKTLLPK